jgi:hypothetical protein
MASTPPLVARRDEEKSAPRNASFLPLGPAPLGIPRTSVRNSGICTTHARTKANQSECPLSNWTELDIWQYIYLENIPIVPLYFSAPRPVVKRDGTLLMVDDERMPLKSGEVPMMRNVRFRTLGCYPDGCRRTDANSLPKIIQEMLLTRTGTTGPDDRPRLGRIHGKEEERVFLMSHVSALISEDIEKYLKAHEQKSLLRFITCGSVDDGKSTLIGRLLYNQRCCSKTRWKHWSRTQSRHAGRQSWISRCWSMVWPQNASKASPSMWPTIPLDRCASSSWPTRLAMSSTPQHGHRCSTADVAVVMIDARRGADSIQAP